jgi:glucose/mannose-6-phosphate isomerase
MQWPASDLVTTVLLLGVGEAGGAVAAYGQLRMDRPIQAVSGYEVPAYVGPSTLVLAVSYSGDTAETRSAALEAHARGAFVVVVTKGGGLGGWASNEGIPTLSIDATFPNDRAALAAEVATLLVVLTHLGVLADCVPSLRAAASLLQRRRAAWQLSDGPAATVARHIGRTMPLTYGAVGLGAVAAQLWKASVNENAKTPAFAGAVPDVSHHEVAGWGQHGDVTRQVFSLVTLRHAGEHPQVAQQMESVVSATDEVMANVIPIWSEGDDDLGRFFDLALMGEFVSLHLAGRDSIDPGPLPAPSDVAAALHPRE